MTIQQRITSVTLLIAVSIVCVGCGSVRRTRAPWLDADAPWCGPNIRAETYLKRVSDGFVRAETYTEWRWHAPFVKAITDNDAWLAAGKYLEHHSGGALGSKVSANWAAMVRGYFGRTEPQTWCLIAVEPLVIAVVEAPLGLVLREGTRVPYAPVVVWFSPDKRVPPTEAEKVDESTRRIPVYWGWLVLDRVGDEWVVGSEAR
jgi:hypothetical protein